MKLRESAPSAHDALPHSAGLRILIVEDHDDSARMLGRLFEMGGHTVFTAATLAEAHLICAQEQALDLIVSDLALPDGDGCELAELARRHGAKAIAVTGCGMPADQDKVRAAGFSAYLLKPVAFEELDATIASITAAAT